MQVPTECLVCGDLLEDNEITWLDPAVLQLFASCVNDDCAFAMDIRLSVEEFNAYT